MPRTAHRNMRAFNLSLLAVLSCVAVIGATPVVIATPLITLTAVPTPVPTG